MTASASAVRPGDRLPEKRGPQITLERIRAVMQVMDDVNPLHLDEGLARAKGLRGAVNQGPANLSYITNMLTAWTGNPDCVRRMQVRFHEVVVPGDTVVAGGTVTSVLGELAECEVWLRFADGRTALSGQAVVALPTGERR